MYVCMCVYTFIRIYVFYFFVCEIVSVFDRQYRVIGLGTVPKLPCRIIYLAHTHPPDITKREASCTQTHTHTRILLHIHVAALQSNSQFSARFIPGMIAGRSRRKIGRYTYTAAAVTPAPTTSNIYEPASPPPDNIAYDPCSFSIKSHTPPHRRRTSFRPPSLLHLRRSPPKSIHSQCSTGLYRRTCS